MTIPLEKVKTWLKIVDIDDEEIQSQIDDELQDVIDEAISELQGSGVPPFDEDHSGYPLYRKAVKYIITRDYESRGTEDYEDRTLLSFVLKLKAMVKDYEV